MADGAPPPRHLGARAHRDACQGGSAQDAGRGHQGHLRQARVERRWEPREEVAEAKDLDVSSGGRAPGGDHKGEEPVQGADGGEECGGGQPAGARVQRRGEGGRCQGVEVVLGQVMFFSSNLILSNILS